MIGSGSVLGSFQARLGLDSTDYAKGMINAESVSRIFGQTFATFVSNPLLGSIDLFKKAGGALITHSQAILADAEAVERLSQQTGASEQLLIATTKRLEIAGFTAERTRQSFNFLTKFIADLNAQGPLSTQVLDQIGISLDGLTGTDEIFRALLDGINELPSAALRSAAAAKIFGEEAGPQLLNAIGGGSDAIDEMIDQYTRLGFVIDGQVNGRLAALNTNLGFLQQAIDGVKGNAIRELLLGLTDTADISDESIIRLAESLNNTIGPAARDFGVILESLLGTLKAVATTIGTIQDVAEEVFFQYFRFEDFTEDFFKKGPDSSTRAAQARNRERAQEYLLDEVGQ